MPAFISKNFTLTWKITSFDLFASVRRGNFIESPVFTVHSLQNTDYDVRLCPSNLENPDFMSFVVRRRGGESKTVDSSVRIGVIAKDGSVRYQKVLESSMESRGELRVAEFVKISDMLPDDTPDNKLTIFCEMTPRTKFNTLQHIRNDTEKLSQDMLLLLRSEFRSDLALHCGAEIFYVHKFIIHCRWPHFCEIFNIENFLEVDHVVVRDVDPSVFSVFVRFLYSGKITGTDLSIDLLTFLDENGFRDMKCFETPLSSMTIETDMNYEEKNITWNLDANSEWKAQPKSFFRVVTLECVYTNQMVVRFLFEDDDWVKIALCPASFERGRPIFIKGNICFVFKENTVNSANFSHLFDNGQEWVLPNVVRMRQVLNKQSHEGCVKIRFRISDGNHESRINSSCINSAEKYRVAKDLENLSKDLTKAFDLKQLADSKLTIGNGDLSVHAALLATRSNVFKHSFSCNNRIQIPDVDPCVAEVLVYYLYSGVLKDCDLRTVIPQLDLIARQYSISSLREMTEKILNIMSH
ncbi:hypothetical protein CDAR_610631 [Caerostris darwini]|uniref:BTB domain-containing protein n=1 Tax=Caerostris darwini TaxID=1538125 RepID=A0AAV4MGH3_9ARAC|nr:hypothetical protein CDAR_610631 [Caerostris darwini]